MPPCLSRLRACLALGALLLLAPPFGLAAPIAPLATGAGSFVFTDDRGNADKPFTVWYDRPAAVTRDSPVVFVMHGVKRNGREYRDTWIPLAEQHKFLLICPEFDERNYPSIAYQRGGIADASGAPLPKEKWTFSAIEHLFDALKISTGGHAEKYFLYGHSAGAQFVHRFVLFLPEARYARAVAANPGWYTMPVFDQAFPYGLQKSPATNETLRAAMARDFTLLLGTEDTDANDENLKQTPKAEAQGKNRLERGQNFIRTANQTAASLGFPLRWRAQTVAGAGHSNRQMETAAADVFFAK